MMLHLTQTDYTRQAWKNGRGVTTELLRIDVAGRLLLRLSRASVVEDGPFSIFPGIERNLTVLSGPGFRLAGAGLDLRCAPLAPVAFPGDVAVVASETGGQRSDDFNVMTANHLPRPEVAVLTRGRLRDPGWRALYAVGPAAANGTAMAPGDLVLSDAPVTLDGTSPVIVARLFGLDDLLAGLRS